MEVAMFHLIGVLVVTGFALYGVAHFVEAHVVADKKKRLS
jgi:hypothetical protein